MNGERDRDREDRDRDAERENSYYCQNLGTEQLQLKFKQKPDKGQIKSAMRLKPWKLMKRNERSWSPPLRHQA